MHQNNDAFMYKLCSKKKFFPPSLAYEWNPYIGAPGKFAILSNNFRDGSACLSYHIDAAGKKWPIPHRRVEWSEEEYFVRSRQVRERSFEACQTLNLAFDLNSG